jgi:hypothetical protein
VTQAPEHLCATASRRMVAALGSPGFLLSLDGFALVRGGLFCLSVGSFNFGATCASVGLRGRVCRRGAGWAQEQAKTSRPGWGHWWGMASYGDDPNDQVQINGCLNFFDWWWLYNLFGPPSP